MPIRAFLRPAPTWTAAQVREFLRQHPPEEYQLIDVSQPKEYAAGHLPGARLIPLEELEGRMGELDPGRTTIVYGGFGLRGRAAANVLINAGFQQVASMEGGVQAWEGKKAEGLPQEDFSYFAAARSPEEHAALAWHLEEGARRFYAEMAVTIQDREAVSLLRELTTAEEHHKEMLLALYEGLSGRPAATDFPAGLLPEPAEQFMEGGMRVEEAIAWTRGRQIRDILELAMALETNAYDRYLLLRRELPDENSRRIFELLSDEEKRHLQKLGHLLEHFV